MAEGRSRETAWAVVKGVWQETSSEEEQEALRYFGDDEIGNLFTLFWDAQFEDDRTEVRNEVGRFIDLVINAHSNDVD